MLHFPSGTINFNLLLWIIVGFVCVCKATECGFPGLPANGSMRGSGILFYPGEEVQYSCVEGFVLFGEEKRKCSDGGQWAGSMPECKHNLALGKPSLQSSTLFSYDPNLAVDGDPDSCSFTPRSPEQRWWQVHLGDKVRIQSVAVHISPGAYQHFTIFVIELLAGNKALYKPCSKFEGQFESEKAVFLCNEGEGGHPGQFVYIRDDREEQEYFGLCEVQVFQYQNVTRCGDPEQPVSSLVNRTSDTSVEYSCVKGYKMDGDKSRFCDHKTGLWSGVSPICKEVQCDHPRSVKDGFIEVSNFRGKYVFGSLATYHCNPGYILWGNASRLCGQEGDWTGATPQCKPITCGQPPEVLNARSTLVNASTLWGTWARYDCKPGFRSTATNNNNKANASDVSSMCTESGIWEPVDLVCQFDPLAISLEDGGYLEGWKTLNGDATMNVSVIVTVAVLSTLAILALVVVVVFFTHRRLNKEGGATRKTSQTSTDQLVSDNNSSKSGGGGSGNAGKGEFPLHSCKAQDSGMMYNTIDVRGSQRKDKKSSSQFDTFPRQQQQQQQHSQQHQHPQNMTSFRPQHSPLPQQPLPVATPVLSTRRCRPQQQQQPPPPRSANSGRSSSSATSVSDCGQRSSGDGGSEEDDSYATVRVNKEGRMVEEEEEEDDDDEESHYSLIRQPDGRAAEGLNGEDDGGYESLFHHQEALRKLKLRMEQDLEENLGMGMESNQVREQVYETLRKQIVLEGGSEVMTSSTGSSSDTPPLTSIKGIRPKIRSSFSPPPSPPELPPPPAFDNMGNCCDVSSLYARVDPAKKRRNRESGTGSSASGSTPCSPIDPCGGGLIPNQQQLSPTKTLIQKFNTLNETDPPPHGSNSRGGSKKMDVVNVHSNPIPGDDRHHRSTVRTVSLDTKSESSEPMYATIGSKNRSQIASRFATKAPKV